MKSFISAAFVSSVLLATPIAASADEAHPYDNGPVWQVSAVLTKPGHFEDYMKFVSTTWRAEQEQAKAKGWVLDYKVLSVTDARENEPDLYLMVEYKNMAVLDAPLDEQDAMAKKLFGSLTAAQKGSVDRETIRTLKGQLLTRELILK